jgi:hypothetical protein
MINCVNSLWCIDTYLYIYILIIYIYIYFFDLFIYSTEPTAALHEDVQFDPLERHAAHALGRVEAQQASYLQQSYGRF